MRRILFALFGFVLATTLSVQPVAAQQAAAQANANSTELRFVVVDETGGPDVRTARVVERRGERLTLDVDAPPGPGAAVLFGQDAAFPDLERWAQWSHHGTWDGSVLTVEDAPGVVGLPPTPGLLERWRRHRDLEKRCRAALRRGRTGRAP